MSRYVFKVVQGRLLNDACKIKRNGGLLHRTVVFLPPLQAKRRPLTDPLIVHVPSLASALAVVDFEGDGGGGDKARRLFTLLTSNLWPGQFRTAILHFC